MKLKKLDKYDVAMITNSIELNIEVWSNWIHSKEYPEGWNKKTSKKMVKQLETLLEKINSQAPDE